MPILSDFALKSGYEGLTVLLYNKIMKFSIRLLYLYLFSFIGLLIGVIGAVQLTDLLIKVYVFKGADTYEYAKPIPVEGDLEFDQEEEKAIQMRETQRQRQRQASTALAMLLVGIPLYKYHWSLIQKEGKRSK